MLNHDDRLVRAETPATSPPWTHSSPTPTRFTAPPAIRGTVRRSRAMGSSSAWLRRVRRFLI